MTPGAEPVRVLLVEDSDVYRDSLVFLLGREPGIEVVDAVATGGEAAKACLELGADVVVIDYRLPDVDGAEAAADVRERCPRASVVFLSASAGERELASARAAGVALVRKDEALEVLVEATSRFESHLDDTAKRAVHERMIRLAPAGKQIRTPLGFYGSPTVERGGASPLDEKVRTLVGRLRSLRRRADPDQLSRHQAGGGLHPPDGLHARGAEHDGHDVHHVLRRLGSRDAPRLSPVPR